MKKLIMIVLFAGSYLIARAEKSLQTDALLTHATVYYGQGAELEHTAKATLVAGSQELVINNIGQSPDVNTIQIACPENVTLLSYRFNLSQETPKPVTDMILLKMQDSIKQLNKQITVTDNDYYIQNEVLTKTASLIETNLINSHEKNISSEDLLKLIEYYSQKIQTIKTAMFGMTQKNNLLRDSINNINARIVDRNKTLAPPATKAIGQLILQVLSQSAGSADFAVSYFTRSAGWLPAYDLRVKSIDNSFKLVYRASVNQYTGIDWKQTKLTLSTGNPNQSSTAPLLNPWFVNIYVPQIAAAVNETVVTGYALRKKAITLDADDYEEIRENKDERMSEGSMVKAYTSLAESQLNISFDIDLPYDIPSDGKPIRVSIKDEMIKAGYKHFAVPKLDRDVFLMAEISDWESLNLMPGEANIIMDNVYLGKSFIDPNTTADTLNISLGRDKRIAVTRTLIKEFSKSKVRGDTKTEDYTYEIVVKNNKTKAVDLVLKDQYPISKVKEIEVTTGDKSNADVNEETGIMTWNVKLEPGESKKFRFSYSLKYPKDKRIRNL